MKSLPKLRGLPGSRKSSQFVLRPALIENAILNLESDEAAEVRRRLHDGQLANRVIKLQREFPRGTIPELVTYDWLSRNGIDFVFQAPAMGGRAVRGGLVIDFVVGQGGVGLAWFIQGDYWHSQVTGLEKNTTDKLSVLGQTVNGLRIEQALELWENKIYDNRPQIFELALQGIELGQ